MSSKGEQPRALVELIDRYCDVWNEPTASRRAELLAQVWAGGATYTDPSVHAGSADELLAHIEKVRARRPGVRVLRTSAIDTHQIDSLNLPAGTVLASRAMADAAPALVEFPAVEARVAHTAPPLPVTPRLGFRFFSVYFGLDAVCTQMLSGFIPFPLNLAGLTRVQLGPGISVQPLMLTRQRTSNR